MTYSAPVAAAVARLIQAHKQLEQALLDRCGTTEDGLAQPRWLLCLAQKAIEGIVLVADFTAVEIHGRAQGEIARIIKVVDGTLPRVPTSRDMTIDDAAPVLLPLIDEIKPLVVLVTSLDKYISPTGKLF
ncbi:hypothetical protein ASG35_03005 [Burkholderia sp. Leaf177]|uniref:hypothetical protein n=1 Tax=Burkholderia sp. Leaf177 TaxID=1736287 RepID=UPI0006FAC35D|nr:hypothetical protein [Burkholderia sp. Leaf177]KQR90194.1 hypothetical protein ASG35_03005 [Burkholderia sp. Leaf177]